MHSARSKTGVCRSSLPFISISHARSSLALLFKFLLIESNGFFFFVCLFGIALNVELPSLQPSVRL